MLQKKRKQQLEEGMVMDAQGVIYRQEGDEKILVKVDDHSPMMKSSGWGVDCYEIEPGTTKIEYNAFNSCDALKKVIVPNTVRVIDDYVFSWCSNLEEVYFQQPSELRFIPEHVCQQCDKLREIVIPDSVSYISDYAFSFCKGIRKIVLPDNIGFEKPADYTSKGTSDLIESLGMGFKLLQYSLGALECVMIPSDKRELLEEHWPQLKHLFVDK